VYVRPAAGAGEAVIVSAEGGGGPAWSADDAELFFLEPPTSAGGTSRMMRVPMTNPARPGRPAALFSYSQENLLPLGTLFTPYAVSPDGRTFYAVQQPPRPPVSRALAEINLVLNWTETLKGRQ
jgi:hypothetical protein